MLQCPVKTVILRLYAQFDDYKYQYSGAGTWIDMAYPLLFDLLAFYQLLVSSLFYSSKVISFLFL